nr:immunoglobulin heavy chain junction region [Mus musculus]
CARRDYYGSTNFDYW